VTYAETSFKTSDNAAAIGAKNNIDIKLLQNATNFRFFTFCTIIIIIIIIIVVVVIFC
jgi:t-SNARE complex subunit (syntaxin)